MTLLANRPCLHCGVDRLHIGMQCMECKAGEPPKERKPVARKKRPRITGRVWGRPRSMWLTHREMEVTGLLATGMQQDEVAAKLGLERSSVASCLRRAMFRIGAANTHELIVRAHKAKQRAAGVG
jgi:DNA-binding CsgD family transcriptional regulator